MTPTTLYSDKKLFISLYKTALRRMKGMGFIYALLSFITFPMFYITEAVEYGERINQGYSYNSFNGTPEIYTPIAAVLYFALIICGAVLISVFINSFMHNRRAVDVFHALPVKRGQQLMANFAAVVTLLLTVQFVCYGIVAVVNAVLIGEPLVAIVLEALRVALLTVLIVVIAFFCSVCCNAGLDSAMFTGAFLIIVPAYTLLVVFLMESFVTGFYGQDDILIDSLVFSPAAMMWQTFASEDLHQGVLLNAIYCVLAVALVYFTCRLYVKRKSEMAQSASTKNPLYQFMLLAASVGGGVFFGFFYNEIFGRNSESLGHIMLSSCLFTVAIYLVFNAIVSRNPKPTKRGIAGLGVSLAVVVAFLLVADNGFFGYERYIPSTEEIHSATINYVGDYGNVATVAANDYSEYLWYTSDDDVTFTDSEGIELVKAAHSTIVEHVGDSRGTECFYRNVTITYNLKNGRTVKRRYYSSIPSSVIPVLKEIEDLESFKTQLYPVFWTDAEYVRNFEIKDGYGDNYRVLSNLTGEEKEKLHNAIAQDTINITRQMKDQRKGTVFAKIQVNYINNEETITAAMKHQAEMDAMEKATEQVTVEMAVQDYTYKNKLDFESIYNNVVFEVTQDCINTIRVLTELGLEEYTQFKVPEGKQAVVLPLYNSLGYEGNDPYWRANTMFDQYEYMDTLRWEDIARMEIYSDSDKLAQLAQACQTSLYMPAQQTLPYAVAFIDKDVDWREIDVTEFDSAIYYMSAANAPDFVKADLAQFNKDSLSYLHFSTVD